MIKLKKTSTQHRLSCIESILSEGPKTMEEITEAMQTSRRCTQNYILLLRLKGQVYIKEYRPEMKHKHLSNAKVYAWGEGVDAEPFSRRELERNAKRRAKEKPAQAPAKPVIKEDWMTSWIPRRSK